MRKCVFCGLVLAFVAATCGMNAHATSIDLAVSTPTTSTSPIVAGSNIVYTFNAINNSGTAAPAGTVNVTVNMPVTSAPATTAGFVSLTGPAGWALSVTPAQGATTAAVITNTTTTLATGAPATFTLTAKVNSGAANNSTITDTVSIAHTVASGNTDNVAGNNSGTSATGTVTISADMAVSITGPTSYFAGGKRTVTITVQNLGPSDSPPITTMIMPLPPAGITIGATVNGGNVTPTAFFPNNGNGGYQANYGIPFPAGGISTLTFDESAAANAAVPINYSDVPAVTHSTQVPDPAANNSATLAGSVTASHDLSVTYTANNGNTAGQDRTLSVTVANAGPSDATNLTLTQDSAGGATVKTIAKLTGPNGSQTGNVFTFPSFPAGSNATLTITEGINPGTKGPMTDTATVAAAGTDPAAGNNTATSNITVNQIADLVMTMTATPSFATTPGNVGIGDTITYAISLSSNGPSSASAVVITSPIPANTTFVSANTATNTNGPTFNVTSNATTVTLTAAGDFPPNASETINVLYRVNQGTAANTNIVHAPTVATTGQNAAGNDAPSSTLSTKVITDVQVQVVSASPNPASAGDPLAYTITLKNNGPTNANGVTFNTSTPAQTTFVSFSQSPPAPAFTMNTPAVGSGGVVNSTPTAVPAGATVTFTFTVNVNSSASGASLSETASANVLPEDPNAANNSSQLTTPLVVPPTSVNIDDITVVEGSGGTVDAVFTVTVKGFNQTLIVVDYATVDGTATAPSQYTATSGQLKFFPQDKALTIKVPIVTDSIVEPDQTFSVKLSNAVNAAIGKGTGVCTIRNDDIAGTIQFEKANYVFPENAGVAAITLTRPDGNANGASVSFTTADQTAVAGVDYTAVSTTVNFAANQNVATVNIPLLNKYAANSSVKVAMTISNPGGGAALGAQTTAVLTILALPAFTSPLNVTGQVGTAFSYLPTAVGEPNVAITVPFPETLPGGLFYSAGYITGTPTQVGSFVVPIVATNSVGVDNKNLIIDIAAIPTPPNTPGTSIDSDGDGFPDEIEVIAETDPLSSKSTPILNQPAQPSSISNVKLAIKLDFTRAANDSIQLSGVVSLPGGSDNSGKLVFVDIGGVTRRFALDSDGKSKIGGDSLNFKLGRNKSVTNAAAFKLKLTKATAAALLADDGLTNESLTKVPRTIPVLLMLNTSFATVKQSQVYTAKKGLKGQSKNP